MRVSSNAHPAWVSLCVLVCAAVAINGCSRARYRLQADREAHDIIAERNVDPRWCVADYGIEIDPRSRYFDPYDPDCPPMPPDDPASHQYMHCVAGMKGWGHWHDNGDRIELENPAWREALAEYVETTEDGSVKLNVDSALKLAYVHSPSHQSQLETLYLSALDVSRERFRLDTQFFGGHADTFQHGGRLSDGGERNTLTLGTDAQVSRDLATAGQLLVGFANSFVFEFAGPDTNFTSSIVNFSLVQPLLRGAGRDIALEQLTAVERALLANLRAYSQYRQGFYTQVAIGELGVAGPQRGGGGTAIAATSGAGGGGGYIGLLEQLQRKRNSEANLSLQERSLARLEAFEEIGAINLVQVDQFRQSIENERAALLQIEDAFELSLDGYKTGTLGLPPDLPIELDDSLIRQFQLVAPEATAIEESTVGLQDRVGKIAELQYLVDKVAELQGRVGELPDEAEVEAILQVLRDFSELVKAVGRQLDDVQADLARLEKAIQAREQTMTKAERELIQLVREELDEGLADLRQQFDEAKTRLTTLREGLSEETKEATVRENVVWLRDFLRLVQGCILIQARTRLEVAPIRQVLADVLELVGLVGRQLDDVQTDLDRMDEKVPVRERTMTDEEKKEFQGDREWLRVQFAKLKQKYEKTKSELTALRDGLSEETKEKTVNGSVVWLGELLRLVQGSMLVQARARLEIVSIQTIELDSQEAFRIALANRMDFMNGRAALVDSWRSIQVAADALQSVLDVTASGDIRTARDNPVSFRAPTATLQLGLEFDAPFTRLLERNDYRESLIDYQRSRRSFIQSRDSLHLGLRGLLRQIERLRKDLEIQRRAVTIAIRQVDMTRAGFYAPVRPPEPGQRPAQFGPTAARDLLGALASLRNAQNRLMSVWLDHYAAKMRLARELGIMVLDQEGRWIDYPILSSGDEGPLDGDNPALEEVPLPPPIPAEWIDPVGFSPRQSNAPPPAGVESQGDHAAKRPNEPNQM